MVDRGTVSYHSENCIEDFVGHQFWRQKPLEHEPFDQGVYHAYELIGGHGEIFFWASAKARAISGELHLAARVVL
ncbi:MAG: hypothetical protein H7Y20_01465 [Bryobacteraceae bacterium]|nr:hypothetical protein [Bryobacteraceae bacterium]